MKRSAAEYKLAICSLSQPVNPPRFGEKDNEQMAGLYSAADLFISTSMGEGFGLTIAESLACGTPVIAQDVSAITEVVGPGGVLIPPASPFTVPMGQEQMFRTSRRSPMRSTISISVVASGETWNRRTGTRRTVFPWDVAARRFHALIPELAEASAPQEETDDTEVPDLHGTAQGV